VATEVPDTHHHQNQKAGAQEEDQEQSDAAQPLMAGEAGMGCFCLAALLILFARGTRHDTVTLWHFRTRLGFYQPRVCMETCRALRKTPSMG
jgi:hypothetical protein